MISAYFYDFCETLNVINYSMDGIIKNVVHIKVDKNTNLQV